MSSAIFRERKRKREKRETVQSRREWGGSDKHKQWSNLSRWIYSSTAMINSKGICSYNRSFRVFFFLTRICSYCFWFAFFFFSIKKYRYAWYALHVGFFFLFLFFYVWFGCELWFLLCRESMEDMNGKNIGFLRCIIMESRFLNFLLVMEIVFFFFLVKSYGNCFASQMHGFESRGDFIWFINVIIVGEYFAFLP